MRSAAGVAVLALGLCLVIADCAGSYLPEVNPHPDGGLGGQVDGGTPHPDGSVIGPDGGLACVQVADASVVINDQCPSGSRTADPAGHYTVSSTCAVTIDTHGADGVCTGTADGGANAFNGACPSGALTCASTSLPGVLSCTTAGTNCTLSVCDAGSSCP